MNTYAPTQHDIAQVVAIRVAWVTARERKDWAVADRLRRYLNNAGMLPPDYMYFHPVFESPQHRQRRLKAQATPPAH